MSVQIQNHSKEAVWQGDSTAPQPELYQTVLSKLPNARSANQARCMNDAFKLRQ